MFANNIESYPQEKQFYQILLRQSNRAGERQTGEEKKRRKTEIWKNLYTSTYIFSENP